MSAENKEQKPAAAPAAELDPVAAAKKAEKEKKNEEKRLAKMAKFAAKQAKVRIYRDIDRRFLSSSSYSSSSWTTA